MTMLLNKFLLLATLLSCCIIGQPQRGGLVNAVVSEICVNETEVVQNQSSVQQELQMALSHVQGHNFDFNWTGLTTIQALVEFQGDNKTIEMFENFCDRAGGKVIHRRIDLDKNSLGLFTVNISFAGIPQCVGLSCDESTIEDTDLPNNVYENFMNEMSVGDICTAGQQSWGELDFWTSFAVKIAKMGGVDLGDCFGSGSNSTSSDDEDTGRRLDLGGGGGGGVRGLLRGGSHLLRSSSSVGGGSGPFGGLGFTGGRRKLVPL